MNVHKVLLKYTILISFFTFIVVKANFESSFLSHFSLNRTNTDINVSDNASNKLSLKKNNKNSMKLKKYELKKVSKIREHLEKNDHIVYFANYNVKTSSGNVTKKIYKIQKSNKYGLVAENGKKISPIIYDDIKDLNNKNGLFIVTAKNKQGLINATGKVLIYPKYNEILTTINKNVLLVKTNKYFGLYDLSKQVFIARPIYKAIENLDDTNWKIFSGKSVGLIYNNNGVSNIIRPKYETIEKYKSVFKTTSEKKEGLISAQGAHIVVEPKYQNIEYLGKNANTLIFKTKIDKRYGVIFYSDNGSTIITPIYDEVLLKGKVNVLSAGYWIILDNNGDVTNR